MQEEKNPENRTQEVVEETTQSQKENGLKKSLRNKSLVLVATGALLVALIIVAAVAWYTRISVINQMTMDAANFDFSVNYTDTSFIIYAEDYLNIYATETNATIGNATFANARYPAAPGTMGVIPIKVSAEDSDIDVDYNLNVSVASMDPEFVKRIRFFYIKRDGDSYASDSNGRPIEVTLTSNDFITGKLKAQNSQYEFIYWEWVYNLNQNRFYDPENEAWFIATQPNSGKARFDELYSATDTDAVAEFDEFDTKIGTGQFNATCPNAKGGAPYEQSVITVRKYVQGQSEPVTIEQNVYAYQKAMEAKLDVSGAMATPVHKEEAIINYQSDTGTRGSAYCPVETVIIAHKTLAGGA